LHYQLIIGIILVFGIYFQWFEVRSLIFVMFIFLTAHGLNGPNTAALSMAPFSRNAGSASAILGSLRMAFGGLASAGVSLFHDGTSLPMVTVMAVCVICGFIVLKLDQNISGTISKVYNKQIVPG